MKEKNKEYNLTIGDRLSLLGSALSEHILIMALSLFFLVIGLVLVVSAVHLHWILYVMGGISLAAAAGLAFSLTSSLPHTFRQKEAGSFGTSIKGTVTGKRIDKDTITREHSEAGWTSIPVDIFVIEYTYTMDREYQGEVIIENKVFFDAINKGDEIPLKVLRHRPKDNKPRLISMGKKYRLSRKESR
jgi:hypothetical protein